MHGASAAALFSGCCGAGEHQQSGGDTSYIYAVEFFSALNKPEQEWTDK